MPGFIFKRSPREAARRLQNEAPPEYRRGGLSGYVRDPEEAFRLQRERGYDDPSMKPYLTDTDTNPSHVLAREAGIDPESLAPRKRRK